MSLVEKKSFQGLKFTTKKNCVFAIYYKKVTQAEVIYIKLQLEECAVLAVKTFVKMIIFEHCKPTKNVNLKV